MWHAARAFALGQALYGAAQARKLPSACSAHGYHVCGRHPRARQLARRRICLHQAPRVLSQGFSTPAQA